MYQRLVCGVTLAIAVVLAGCATTSSTDSIAPTVLATHTSVKKLENELGGSVAQLNSTAADLTARVSESERQTKELKSSLEEVQVNVARVESKLDSLTGTLYKYLNLTPGASGGTAPDVEVVPPPAQTSAVEEPSGLAEPSAETPAVPPAPAPGTPAAPAPATPEGTPAAPAAPAAAPPAAAEDEALYNQAQNEFKRQNYDAALTGFDDYLKRYPNSDSANKAQFWKGECCLRQGKYEQAITEFQTLREKYKMSSYVPVSLHNEAAAHLQLGQRTEAVNLLRELVENYPMSPAAERAREKLKEFESN